MRTFVQANVITRCATGGPLTAGWLRPNTDVYGDGSPPGLGGSNLSALGGVLRLGELVPGAPPIRHALQVNLFGRENLFFDTVTKGFRWPATKADGNAAIEYRGTNPPLRMGSLLAIPASIDITALGIETEPARMLAWTLQNYGAYVVNDTNWSVYAIITEGGPAGYVTNEFRSLWGFQFSPQSKDVPWSRDMDRLFLNLHVVDNWNHSLYKTVSASGGTQGAGGGPPRQSWAPTIPTPTPTQGAEGEPPRQPRAPSIPVPTPRRGAGPTPPQPWAPSIPAPIPGPAPPYYHSPDSPPARTRTRGPQLIATRVGGPETPDARTVNLYADRYDSIHALQPLSNRDRKSVV